MRATTRSSPTRRLRTRFRRRRIRRTSCRWGWRRPSRPALENAAHVVALEVLAAAQGLEFLKPLRAGVGPRAALAFVRSAVPPLDEDRSLAGDANRILEWLATGQFLEAAEKAAGRLA